MGENEDFGHILPLLRRIIILVAVITAIPVVLWTITAFVRTYISPPKVPTFHQLAASASADAPLDIKPPQTVSVPQTPTVPAETSKPSQPMSVTVAARATATGDASAAPKGPFLGDHAAEQAANAPAANAPATSTQPVNAATMNAATMNGATMNTPATMPTASLPKLADTSPMPPAETKAAEVPAAPATEPSAATAMPPNTVAAQQPAAAAASDPAADTLAAAAPLSGPVPLPRHRPRDAGEMRMAEMAPITPATVPMPRPRPDAAGPGAPAADTASGSPLDFLTNIFGGTK